MSVQYSPSNRSPDFLTEVAKGNIGGHSLVHKFGRNAAVGTSYVPLSFGAVYQTPQPAAATTLRVKAGHADDTAAGDGARGVTVQGLDETGALVTEALVTAGESASSATTTTFIRLFRAYVDSSGTYVGTGSASHADDVVIENGSGGTDWLTIDATGFARGQSEVGAYTVPLGKTAYLMSYGITSDGTKAHSWMMFKREYVLAAAAPYQARRLQFESVGFQGQTRAILSAPSEYGELTDLGFVAKVASGTADIAVEFELLLVDD